MISLKLYGFKFITYESMQIIPICNINYDPQLLITSIMVYENDEL